MTKRQFLKEHAIHTKKELLNSEILYVVDRIIKRDDINDDVKIWEIKTFLNGWLTAEDVL